jgi:hypothetical protein
MPAEDPAGDLSHSGEGVAGTAAVCGVPMSGLMSKPGEALSSISSERSGAGGKARYGLASRLRLHLGLGLLKRRAG